MAVSQSNVYSLSQKPQGGMAAAPLCSCAFSVFISVCCMHAMGQLPEITMMMMMMTTIVYRSPYKPESGIRSFLMMPAEDFEEFDILPYMLEAIAFLSRAESSSGCGFVHCNYGVNRSGVVAAAYLMVSEHKPLLQVINELKARRSLILSNVGFRRQLVRFARCRGLLDLVERPSRRSPRLEPGKKTPRSVTPSNDETKDDPDAQEPAELSDKETPEKNGDEPPKPPRNGYHIAPPVLTISTDLELNGVQSNGPLRPRHGPVTSRRERLLRDIDSTIEALSVRDGADASSTYYTYYRPRDDVDRAVSPATHIYVPPRPPTYLPALDYTPDPVPVPSVSVLSTSPHFDILDRLPHSSDSEDDFPTSSLVSSRSPSFYGGAESSNAILEEYLKYKNASSSSQLAIPRVPPPAAVGELFTSTAKPLSYYSRLSASGSSVIDNYGEAEMNSFLAQRNARRALLSSGKRLNQASTGLDYRRSSASYVDAVLGLPRSHSARKAAMSQEVVRLPPSAYTGRWYPTPSASTGRRYSSTGSAAQFGHVMGMTSFDTGRYDVDVSDDPISGHGMRSVGRTIATRVTPAPGYGHRSNYARSHSVSRFM